MNVVSKMSCFISNDKFSNLKFKIAAKVWSSLKSFFRWFTKMIKWSYHDDFISESMILIFNIFSIMVYVVLLKISNSNFITSVHISIIFQIDTKWSIYYILKWPTNQLPANVARKRRLASKHFPTLLTFPSIIIRS